MKQLRTRMTSLYNSVLAYNIDERRARRYLKKEKQ